jgi:hypothetical protein
MVTNKYCNILTTGGFVISLKVANSRCAGPNISFSCPHYMVLAFPPITQWVVYIKMNAVN